VGWYYDRLVRLFAGAIAAGYFILLLLNTCFFAAGTDSSGYLNHARLIASGRTSAEIPQLRTLQLDPSVTYLFTPYGFGRGPAGRMVPTYPVGMPIHLAVASIAGGWRIAPFLVCPILAMATLFLFVAVAQLFGIARSWAIAGAAILAASPLFIMHALSPLSDMTATFWTLAALWCALKNRPAACGVAFAIAVLVRPTEVLFALPLAIALATAGRNAGATLLRAALSALPIGLALLWYQSHLYGSPWKTGYGGASDVISFLALPPCLSFHATSLVRLMSPLVMPIGLVALFDRKLEPRKRAILAAWFGVFFVFYAFYSYCPSWPSSRFLLPAVPALIIGALRICALIPQRVAIAAVVIALAWEVRQVGSRHALHFDESDSIFPQTVAWVERSVPRDATVLSNHFSGVFYFHSGRITPRWDQLDATTTALLRSREAAKPWFAVVSEGEGGRAELARHVPGDWIARGTLRDVTLWQLQAPVDAAQNAATR
jgi:hypothetical protein